VKDLSCAALTPVPAAHATGLCRVVDIGDGRVVHVQVCVDVDAGQSSTTVAPTVTVTCELSAFLIQPTIRGRLGFTARVSRTGFAPNTVVPRR
jgi:hypothetical protein